MKKTINKKKKILLVLIILILIILFTTIMLAIIINNKDKANSNDNTIMYEEKGMEVEIPLRQIYKGKGNPEYIASEIEDVFEISFPTQEKELFALETDEDFQNYYESKESYISEFLKIESSEELKKIVETAKKIDIDFSDIESLKYVENSYSNDDNNEYFDFVVKYKGSKELNLQAIVMYDAIVKIKSK